MKNDNLIKYNAKRQLELLERQRAEKMALFNELEIQIEQEVAERLKERIEHLQEYEGSVSRDRRLLEEKLIREQVKKEYRRKGNDLNRELNYDFRKEKNDLKYDMQRERLMSRLGEDYYEEEFEEEEASLGKALKYLAIAFIGLLIFA